MNRLELLLKRNRWFYLESLFILVLASFILLSFTKTQSFDFLYGIHSFNLNVFFVNYTFLGDGVFSMALCAYLLYRKQHKLAIYILLACLSSGLATQVLKAIIYTPKPILFVEASQYLFRPDNIGNSGGGENGFPSGHTSAAFAMATVLSNYYKKSLLSTILCLAALLVGYSRIYLAQHFPIDVLAGALIGIIFGTFSIILIDSNVLTKLFRKFNFTFSKWGIQLPDAVIS